MENKKKKWLNTAEYYERRVSKGLQHQKYLSRGGGSGGFASSMFDKPRRPSKRKRKKDEY